MSKSLLDCGHCLAVAFWSHGPQEAGTTENRRAALALLPNLMVCHFNEDFDILYGSLAGAIRAAAVDGSLDHRQAVLKEWRDWNSTEGAVDDIRPTLQDSFSTAVSFKQPIDARELMNSLYDSLITSVRNETRHGA